MPVDTRPAEVYPSGKEGQKEQKRKGWKGGPEKLRQCQKMWHRWPIYQRQSWPQGMKTQLIEQPPEIFPEPNPL